MGPPVTHSGTEMPNQLIDESELGRRAAAAAQTQETIAMPDQPETYRCWLYDIKGQGRLFRGQEAVAEALEQGWFETPADARDAAEEAAAAASGGDKPTDSNTKAEILHWCLEAGLTANANMSKAELLELVAQSE